MLPKRQLIVAVDIVLVLLALLPRTCLSWILHQQHQRTLQFNDGLTTRYDERNQLYYRSATLLTINKRTMPTRRLVRPSSSTSLFVSQTRMPNLVESIRSFNDDNSNNNLVPTTTIVTRKSNDDDNSDRASDGSTTTKTVMISKDSITIPIFELAIAGSITTFFADICMHPMDTIKTTLQSDVGIGWNIIQACDYIFTIGGFAAFYSGFLTYAFSDAVGGAFKFTVWELWKQSIMNQILTTIFPKQHEPSTTKNIGNEQSDSPSITIQEKVLSASLLWAGAAVAFLASSIVIVPGELIKQQLQMGHYATLFDAVQGIMSTQGIRGFYIGYEGVLYRDVPYTMIELGLYEMLKKSIDQYKYNQYQIQLVQENGTTNDVSTNTDTPSLTTSWYEEIGAAAVTGAMSSFCTTPLDTIKTKLMVDQALYHDSTFWDCFYQTVDQHGFGAVFAGVSARMGWIIPFTILYLPTYDYLRRQLQNYHYNDQLVQNEFQQQEQMNHDDKKTVSTDPLTVSTAAVMIASSSSTSSIISSSSITVLFNNATSVATTASMLTNTTSSLNLL